MRRLILPAFSLLLLAGSLIAEDLPPAPVQPIAGDVAKEQKNSDEQYRVIRKKAEQDPDVVKLKAVQDEAQNAYKAKLEAVMMADPAYADLKAKRDESKAKSGKGPDKAKEKDKSKAKEAAPSPNQPPQ